MARDVAAAARDTNQVSFCETGDAVVIAWPSKREPGLVEVVDAIIRRNGEDAPRRPE